MRSDLVDIEVTLHKETYPGEENQGAYLVSTSVSTPRKEWVPKSVAELDGGAPPRNQGTLTLPRSWAEEKGLV
jgi:hypothetical protein